MAKQVPNSLQGLETIRVDENMAAEVAYLNATSWQAAYRGLLPDAFLAAVTPESRMEPIAGIIASGKMEYYVFRVHGQGAGMAALCACRDEDATPRDGEISALYFVPEYWGQSYGRQAMDFCLGRLVECGFETATVWVLRENRRARRFYEKCGLKEDKEAEMDAGGPVVEVRYRMALPPVNHRA